MLNARKTLGELGEKAALALLRAKGFTLLSQNWRSGSYEIDLVCRHGQELVFVEVRTRTGNSLVSPKESVNAAKQAKLLRAARMYLNQHNAWNQPCRFDVVSVIDSGGALHTEHIPHAFEFSPTMGRGHTAWQPW